MVLSCGALPSCACINSKRRHEYTRISARLDSEGLKTLPAGSHLVCGRLSLAGRSACVYELPKSSPTKCSARAKPTEFVTIEEINTHTHTHHWWPFYRAWDGLRRSDGRPRDDDENQVFFQKKRNILEEEGSGSDQHLPRRGGDFGQRQSNSDPDRLHCCACTSAAATGLLPGPVTTGLR